MKIEIPKMNILKGFNREEMTINCIPPLSPEQCCVGLYCVLGYTFKNNVMKVGMGSSERK